MTAPRRVLAAVAASSFLLLSGCGMMPSDDGGGSDGDSADSGKDGEQEKSDSSGGKNEDTWEGQFPDGISPVIEMDEPGGQAQQEAVDAYFSFYGDLFQAMYDKDSEQAFLDKRLTADAPSSETLSTGMNAYIDVNAVPAGDMRFYNGELGAWSQDSVQVDFCVDQRSFTVQDADSGKETELSNESFESEMFQPGVLVASGTFQKGEDDTWRSGSFSISPVEEDGADTYSCLADKEGGQ